MAGKEALDCANNLVFKYLAQYFIEDYNQKQNEQLVFKKVLKGNVVAWEDGKKYSLTLDVADGCENKVYEAEVWVKSELK